MQFLLRPSQSLLLLLLFLDRGSDVLLFLLLLARRLCIPSGRTVDINFAMLVRYRVCLSSSSFSFLGVLVVGIIHSLLVVVRVAFVAPIAFPLPRSFLRLDITLLVRILCLVERFARLAHGQGVFQPVDLDDVDGFETAGGLDWNTSGQLSLQVNDSTVDGSYMRMIS